MPETLAWNDSIIYSFLLLVNGISRKAVCYFSS